MLSRRPKVGMRVRRFSGGALGTVVVNARDDDHFLRVSGGETVVAWDDRSRCFDRTREVWLCDIHAVGLS
jgi:hypothetical protein